MKPYFKILFTWVVFIVSFYRLQAQELRIGDKLPDYTFTSVLRYPSGTVSLADFRGKVLIIDFWRTTCGSCIAAFPHLDSLQNEFGNGLAILPVTTESRDKISHYFRTNTVAKTLHLPTITDDTLMAGKIVKFIYIPHMVIADSSGTVIAITDPKYITREAVRSLLASRKVELPRKMELTDFHSDVPVFWEGKERNARYMQYASAITSMIPGAFPVVETDTSDNRIFYKAYNQAIPDLYAQALHFDYNLNRLVLEVKDSLRFLPPSPGDEFEWKKNNLWVYNLILPKTYSNPNYFALQDLDRFFQTQGSIEERKMKCLVLVKTGKKERWKSKGGEAVYDSKGDLSTIKNIPLFDVCWTWNFSSSLPIVNETGMIGEHIDITVNTTPADLPSFRKQLQPYDLDLIPAERVIKVLVIKDRSE